MQFLLKGNEEMYLFLRNKINNKTNPTLIKR